LARSADIRAASDDHEPQAQLNMQQRSDFTYMECVQEKGNVVSERAAPTTQPE
jgi:hypothetical protein